MSEVQEILTLTVDDSAATTGLKKIEAGLNSVVDGMAIVNVITDSLATAPKVDARLAIEDRSWTIKAVETDPTGAVWRLTCA